MQSRSLSTIEAAHMRKNTRLSIPAQLQCLHSEVGEPGNEATTNVVKLVNMGHLEVWHTLH